MQSEYGWRDEEVMETAVCRLRQIVANIESRQKGERQYQQTITEWQTKTLAAFIAASVPMEKKGQKNPLLDEAMRISLTFEGDEALVKDVPPEVYVEQGSQVAQNKNGSYERLKAVFGG